MLEIMGEVHPFNTRWLIYTCTSHLGDKQMFFNFNSRPMNNLFLSPELPDMDSSLSCSSGYVIDIC